MAIIHINSMNLVFHLCGFETEFSIPKQPHHMPLLRFPEHLQNTVQYYSFSLFTVFPILMLEKA